MALIVSKNVLRNRDEFPALLISLGLTGLGVEVGVYEADFAELLLERWCGKTLYLVDTWRHMADYRDSWRRSDAEMEEMLNHVRRRLERFSRRFQIIRDTSVNAARTFAENYLDFIYLDANHAYEAVRQDLAAWYPKVRAGGIMAGHDYFNALADKNLDPIPGTNAQPEKLTSYGVKAAVDEFCQKLGVQPNITDEEWPTWYFVKP